MSKRTAEDPPPPYKLLDALIDRIHELQREVAALKETSLASSGQVQKLENQVGVFNDMMSQIHVKHAEQKTHYNKLADEVRNGLREHRTLQDELNKVISTNATRPSMWPAALMKTISRS